MALGCCLGFFCLAGVIFCFCFGFVPLFGFVCFEGVVVVFVLLVVFFLKSVFFHSLVHHILGVVEKKTSNQL